MLKEDYRSDSNINCIKSKKKKRYFWLDGYFCNNVVIKMCKVFYLFSFEYIKSTWKFNCFKNNTEY